MLRAAVLGVTLTLFAGQALAQAETTRFSNWEFAPPPMTKTAERSAERLVLKLDASVPGPGGSITIYAGRPAKAGLAALLDEEWKKLVRGKQLRAAEPDAEVELAGGTKGLQRNAPNPAGGYFSLTAYAAKGGVNFLVLEASDEIANGVMSGLSFGFLMSLQVHPVGGAAAPSALAAQTAKPDLKPQPPGPDPYDSINWARPKIVMRTTRDLDEVEIQSAMSEFIGKNRVLLGGVAPKKVSFSDAIATARKAVGYGARTKYLDALRKHPKLQSRSQLVDSAAFMVLAGRPHDALTRLLVAQERWPLDPEVLFNLAGLLAQGRLANESLAILDEMTRRGARHHIGFGIDPKSGTDYLRGYNLMQLGRFAEADALVSKVATRLPQFGEAALTAALLAHQQGKKPVAPFIGGYYRRAQGPMTTPGHEKDQGQGGSGAGKKEAPPAPESRPDWTDLDDSVVLSVVHFVDVSRGKPGKLPSIYQPTAIDDALKYQGWYKSQLPLHEAEAEALAEKSRRLGERWRSKIPPGPQHEYYDEIWRMFTEANARMPEIQRLLRKRDRAIQDSTEASERFNDWFFAKLQKISERHKYDSAKACPEVKELVLQTHDSLRVHVQAVDLAERRLHRVWHRYATALGTLVGDPDFRAYLNHEINYANQTSYWGLVGNMWQSTAYAEYAKACPGEGVKPEWSKNTEGSELAPCDDSATAALSVQSGPFSMSFSCDAVTLGLEIDVGPVEVSGEATVEQTGRVRETKAGGKYKLPGFELSGSRSRDASGRTVDKVGAEASVIPGLSGRADVTMDSQGETSVYMGGKAGVDMKGGGVEVAAYQDSGVVITAKDGAITDVALRSTSTAKATVGGAGFSQSTTHTMSLFPTPGR